MSTKFTLRQASRLLGRVVAYHPIFTQICGGNASAGILLSQFYYLEDKAPSKSGWIEKPVRELREETGLTRYPLEGARKTLRELGFCEETVMGSPAQLHFKFDWDKVDAAIVAFRKAELTPQAFAKALDQEPDKKKVRTNNKCYPSLEVFGELYSVWENNRLQTKDEVYSYTWTEKELGQLKNLVSHLRKRVQEKLGLEDEPDPQTVADMGMRPFLEMYAAMSMEGEWNMQTFTASNMMTHLPDIFIKMNAYAKAIKIGNTNLTHNTVRDAVESTLRRAGYNHQRTGSHQFTDAHIAAVQGVDNW
ncbi:MAG: hypothetical protein HC874_14125 [Richelia sp. SL_2_1]|nr:hypothetical protein [Richelia sp. SL_2_1]